MSALTKAGLGVGVDVLILAPLHHALEDGHQTFQPLLPQGQLLRHRHRHRHRFTLGHIGTYTKKIHNNAKKIQKLFRFEDDLD